MKYDFKLLKEIHIEAYRNYLRLFHVKRVDEPSGGIEDYVLIAIDPYENVTPFEEAFRLYYRYKDFMNPTGTSHYKVQQYYDTSLTAHFDFSKEAWNFWCCFDAFDDNPTKFYELDISHSEIERLLKG